MTEKKPFRLDLDRLENDYPELVAFINDQSYDEQLEALKVIAPAMTRAGMAAGARAINGTNELRSDLFTGGDWTTGEVDTQLTALCNAEEQAAFKAIFPDTFEAEDLNSSGEEDLNSAPETQAAQAETVKYDWGTPDDGIHIAETSRDEYVRKLVEAVMTRKRACKPIPDWAVGVTEATIKTIAEAKFDHRNDPSMNQAGTSETKTKSTTFGG